MKGVRQEQINKLISKNKAFIKTGKSKLYRESVLYGIYKRVFTLKEIKKLTN